MHNHFRKNKFHIASVSNKYLYHRYYRNKFFIIVGILCYLYFSTYSLLKGIQNKYNYTIVIPQSQSKTQMFTMTINSLQKQNFKNWILIYFSNQTQQQLLKRKQYLKQLNIEEKVMILNSHENSGMNFYQAFNNKCKLKTVGIILNQGEIFQSQYSLKKIVNQFQTDNNIYIMAVGVKANETSHQPSKLIQNFKRYNFLDKQNKKRIYQNVSMHVRAFITDYFRDIYPFDIMNIQDKFYSNKIYFLFPILEMKTKCEYCIRYNNNQFNNVLLPVTIKIINQNIIIAQSYDNQYNQQVQQIFQKQSYQPLRYKYDTDIQKFTQFAKPQTWGQDIKPGQYNLLKRHNPTNVSRIQKNVHQFWINKNQLPPLRKKLSQIVQQKYKGYTYRLWTLENITRQNFPRTYHIIIKLIQYDKQSPMSRMSMVADLMRLEAIFNYGGFHVDLNYEIFKTYDQFRHYELVVGLQLQYQIPKTTSMGTWGAQKGSKFIDQILTPKYLDKINIGGMANVETGPHFLGKVISMEDMYYRIKYIPTQFYLPFLEWSNDPRFHQCKCRFKNQIPKQLQGTYNFTVFIKGFTTIIPCQKRYPSYVYGLDHFYNGGTWDKKTQ